jgi:type III secretion protein D
MSSQPMKRLRILTGRHAGASLDLPSGQHHTGPDHDCDISINDWTFAPLQLSLDDSGEVTARWYLAGSAEPPATPSQHRFTDFQPRAFGDIVLCFGPVDQPWPSDLQLLDSTFQPTPQRVARWAGMRLRAGAASVVGGAVVLSLCVMASVLMMGAPKANKPAETVASVTARVQQLVSQSGVRGLKVEVDPSNRSGVLVSGMVETAAQSRSLSTALAGLSSTLPVLQRVAVASDVAESIRSSVGVAGAEVKYMGAGVFAYTAETNDAKAVRQAIDRVSADLGDAVRRIDVTLELGDKKPVDVPILSSMKDGEISVVQTRDGVKHLVVTEPERTVAVGKALSLPPTGVRQR